MPQRSTSRVIIITLISIVLVAINARADQVAGDAALTLGNYPNTSVALSSDATITPDATPTNTTSISVSTTTGFVGELTADAATGVVRVTNANHANIPPAAYTVIVRAFGPGGTATKTFLLTVTDGRACAAVPGFSVAADVGVGSFPLATAVGDFNNDGRQDIAAANFNANTVSIRLGDGSGGFSGSTEVNVGSGPIAIAVGDVNNDGKADIAVANRNSTTVSVRLGNGLGGFNGTTEVVVGSGPISVALGDFNNDGKLDIAVANYFSNNVSIRIGDGLGGFSGTINVSAAGNAAAVAVCDLNNDGKPDIAVANDNIPGTVSIRVGDGLGGFSGTADIGVGDDPASVAIGDFNNDGNQDLAAANFNSDTVSIRLSDGMGGFSSAADVAVGLSPNSVAIGDFNNDGKQDIAVANYESNTISMRLGDGLGGFSGSTEADVGNAPGSVAIGDFNGDGKQDIAVANRNSNKVLIRLGACMAATPTNTPTPTPTAPPTACNLAEGFTDITILPAAGWIQTNNSQPGPGLSGWFQGDSGTFPAQSPSPVASPTPTTASYISADYNNGTGVSTLSNWLITPPVVLANGGQLTFWTRTIGAPKFPDRLQVRLSTNGTSSDVGTTATSVGDFAMLLLDINPTYVLIGAGSYPNSWTQFSVTLSGLGSTTTGRLAFRYFVENGGPSGANSDVIGIDTIVYACNTVTPTPTATPTNTATATPTSTPVGATISGTVTYPNASSQPQYVSNVLISGAGSPNVFTTTLAPGAGAGTYTLSGFGAGSYTVTPTKTNGVNGITSFDAGRIAQHVAGMGPPYFPYQSIAADTSNNGSISSFDAGLIAKYVVGSPPFGITGTWRFFTPNPTFPVGSSPTNRTYPSVSGTITGQDYVGILMGEVSGNWDPSLPRQTGRGNDLPGRNVIVNAAHLVTPVDNEIIIPVNLQGAVDKGIISYEFDLRYDPSVIQPLANPVDLARTVSRALSFVANAEEPGLLRVAVYGPRPIDDSGVLLNLRFTAFGKPGLVSPLTWERIMFNEGDPQVLAADGQVELSDGREILAADR